MDEFEVTGQGELDLGLDDGRAPRPAARPSRGRPAARPPRPSADDGHGDDWHGEDWADGDWADGDWEPGDVGDPETDPDDYQAWLAFASRGMPLLGASHSRLPPSVFKAVWRLVRCLC